MSSRDELRRRHAEEVDALEATVFSHLYQSLVQWLKKVLDKILVPFDLFGVKPDANAVWSAVPEWEAVADHMAYDHLGQVADRGGNGVGVSGNSFVQAQLARTRNLLARVPNDVYNMVFAEISEGVNAGEPNEDIAARVQRVLETSGSELWRNRAMTIARTETIRAYNAGAIGSAFRAQDAEQIPMVKEWLATEDQKTRASHRLADGQERLLMEPFQVGGSFLMFPEDPMGQPEEVINCRCTMIVKEAAGA